MGGGTMIERFANFIAVAGRRKTLLFDVALSPIAAVPRPQL